MGTVFRQLSEVDEMTEAYNAFRMRLFIALKRADFDASIMANGLAEWISVKENAEWAMREGMGDCGKHRKPHTLYQCLCDEMQYWVLRANGATVKDANIKALGYDPTY